MEKFADRDTLEMPSETLQQPTTLSLVFKLTGSFLLCVVLTVQLDETFVFLDRQRWSFYARKKNVARVGEYCAQEAVLVVLTEQARAGGLEV